MKLSIGFSPCPNDTFIFDALVNNKIETDGFAFTPVLEDVETLNKWALEGKLDITKLSFPAFFQSASHYVLMNAGSALGKAVGPLLVSRQEQFPSEAIVHSSIALPGEHTTANLLFSFAYPQAGQKRFMVFSAIEDAVASGETELGVIIHENRFTYQQKGLHKVLDLGEYWEKEMKSPTPLGGIAVKRSIDPSVSRQLELLVRKSLERAFSVYPFISDYVKAHSQTMREDVMRRHIELYVNNYSLDLGNEGRHAIRELQKVFQTTTGNKAPSPELFL